MTFIRIAVGSLLLAGDLSGQLTPEWTVGDESEATAVWFATVGEVVSASDGGVLVADPAEGRIALISRTGAFVRWLGGPGAGPGEFATISKIVTRGDTVIAFDAAQRRRVALLTDGTHLSTQMVEQQAGLPIGVAIEMTGGIELLVATPRFVRGAGGHAPYEIIMLRRVDQLDTLQTSRSSGAMWGNADRVAPWGLAETPFGAGGAWAVVDDSTVVLADGYAGSVRWMRVRRGEIATVREETLEAESQAVSVDDLRTFEQAFRDGRERPLPRRIDIDAPPRWSVASQVYVAGEDVWVRTRTGHEGREEWLVLAGDGTQRPETLPAGFELRLVTETHLIGRVESEAGAPMVVALGR